MKRFIYICSVLFLLVLSGCQNEDVYDGGNESNNGRNIVQFNLTIPEYLIPERNLRASAENTANQMWLLVFDDNGLFIERVQATDLVSEEQGGTGVGSFKASVSDRAKIIHFVANYDKWSSFDDRASMNKNEQEIIPGLVTSKMVFWGRNTISSLNDPIDVVLYRNQAKVAVQSEADNFQLTGYAVMNYVAKGTVAPFKPDATPSPFIISEDEPTMPSGATNNNNQAAKDCTLTPKYIFEDKNYFNDQIYVILKGRLNGGEELFYKIQLLDEDKIPYPIIRNYIYNVLIKSFNGNAHGSSSFEGAMSAEPSNNIYAEIFKDSPTISDTENNVLTVGRIHVLYTKAETLNVTANYTKNGVVANSEIEVNVLSDPGGILSGLSYDGNGLITANVAQVVVGQQEALISVQAGVLSRIITVVSSELYEFDPVGMSPEFYTHRDEEMTLSFTIPSDIPYYLFPFECVITTKKLYPSGSNVDLPLRYKNGSYNYIYIANGPGKVDLTFKTSLEDSDETFTIENEYFKDASVDMKSRYFSNVSINDNKMVDYGINKSAVLKFTMVDAPDSPTTGSVTVHIATTTLSTSDSNWQAVSGGYSRTYTSLPSGEQTVVFTSNKEAAFEELVLSANGFRNKTSRFDYVLTSDMPISNTIKQKKANGQIVNLYGYTIDSSDESIVPKFVTSVDQAVPSTYSTIVKSGSKLASQVTLSFSAFSDTYTVEELLDSPEILLMNVNY